MDKHEVNLPAHAECGGKKRKKRRQRKSKGRLEKNREDNRERMSKFLQKKDEVRALKDSLARQEALEKLGVKQEFNYEDHAEIYSYSADAQTAPIETVDASIAPLEASVEQIHKQIDALRATCTGNVESDDPIDPSTPRAALPSSRRVERFTTVRSICKLCRCMASTDLPTFDRVWRRAAPSQRRNRYF